MNRTGDQLETSQLLGRLTYFHVLFIEPVLDPSAMPSSGEMCCNHGPDPAPAWPTVDQVLRPTAWNAVDEVAATIPAHHQVCPRRSGSCCAACRTATASAAVAAAWAEAEHRAYHRTPPSEDVLHACRTAGAARLGGAFATRHTEPCPAVDRAVARVLPALVPSPDVLPLTGELLALWTDPATAARRPVVGWLNHCTGLDDVRRVLQTRRFHT
ncbi:hypothetical protein [Streptomyces sp. NPDC001380]|uniref:hypothetical protein n=1 Tax=Streptomyces sp. NPDC001380 TaxID=3364566 RepID=UPI003683A605